jgi:hypothetical protein
VQAVQLLEHPDRQITESIQTLPADRFRLQLQQEVAEADGLPAAPVCKGRTADAVAAEWVEQELHLCWSEQDRKASTAEQDPLQDQETAAVAAVEWGQLEATQRTAQTPEATEALELLHIQHGDQ